MRNRPLTVKVWCSDEAEPPDGLGFNPIQKEHGNQPPRGWFEEDPELAAELYVLERFRCSATKAIVLVRNSDGLHTFDVTVRLEPVTTVTPRGEVAP